MYKPAGLLGLEGDSGVNLFFKGLVEMGYVPATYTPSVQFNGFRETPE